MAAEMQAAISSARLAEADADLFYNVDDSGADLSHQAAVFVDVAFPRLPRLDCCDL
jgi:hypothetical protein